MSVRHKASRTQAEIKSFIDLRWQRTKVRAARAAGNKRDPRKEGTTEKTPRPHINSNTWLKLELWIHGGNRRNPEKVKARRLKI